MQLAIDTSTGMASLALVQDGEILAELTWHCGQNHTTELLPRLLDLLNRSRLSIQSIGGIIIAGPVGNTVADGQVVIAEHSDDRICITVNQY